MSDRYQNRDDLTDSLVRLDRRVLDCLVGLEDESTEVAESASLAATPHPETPTLNTLTRPYPYNPGGGECEPLLP